MSLIMSLPTSHPNRSPKSLSRWSSKKTHVSRQHRLIPHVSSHIRERMLAHAKQPLPKQARVCNDRHRNTSHQHYLLQMLYSGQTQLAHDARPLHEADSESQFHQYLKSNQTDPCAFFRVFIFLPRISTSPFSLYSFPVKSEKLLESFSLFTWHPTWQTSSALLTFQWSLTSWWVPVLASASRAFLNSTGICTIAVISFLASLWTPYGHHNLA